MYSDLLDVLGGGNAAVGASSSSSSENNRHIATSFKAGKMNLEPREGGKFWVTPDTRRGTVQLVWTSSNSLKWEWKCRRNNDEVVDSFDVTPGATFERVESPTGRVYVLSQPRCMYWMQDASDENDDDICVQVNQYLANPDEAKPEGSSGDAAMAQAMQTSSSTTTTTHSSSSGNTNQVDALSNILENLGMPQQNQQQSTATATTGTLTLADLQGAMSGLGASTAPAAAAAAAAAAGPPLQEIVTPEAISSLLEDEAVCARLLELLPEEQQTRQHLEDNLRSPQVQQTLRSLTAALAPDDAGSMEGYHSVLANFSLDPQDGQAALASGNPIQAFLDAVVASVKQDEEETKEEEEDHAMEE